jgi:hypothetical protein
MSYPPSRRNQLSEYYVNTGLVNYNLRSPLDVSPDFFSFPCKGFPKGPVVATFEKNEITISLEGTATHGGGHCQFGISYDDKNFVVLKTVLNDCLLDTMSYSYEIPKYARGDNITVFWTWINRIGNREYYMECADVNVKTNGKITNIPGKELLIVNLPGYSTVPEWQVNSPSSVDGRDLLASRKNINVNSDKHNSDKHNSDKHNSDKHNSDKHNSDKHNSDKHNSDKHIISEKSQEKVNEKSQDKVKEKNQDQSQEKVNEKCSCTTGEMKCDGNGFITCANNNWVYRNCASGTSCKTSGESIVCDFA